MKIRELWFHVRSDTDIELVNKAIQLDFQVLMGTRSAFESIESTLLPQRISVALVLNSAADVDAIPKLPYANKIACVLSSDVELLRHAALAAYRRGWLARVDDAEQLHAVVSRVGQFDLIAVSFKDPTNIPLELVLATSQSGNTQIFKLVQGALDGEVSLQTMEKGSDGIILSSDDPNELVKLCEGYTRSQSSSLVLVPAVVKRIHHAEMGDRVCVDTTSILGADEGMIVGSTSSGGIMVCSETHYLPYMNLRPFRVNAGGVHMYVWGPGGTAYYLSDLKAGDVVWAVNANGRARRVTVGRVKIERRPLLLIETEIEGVGVNCFIQDDWHVRVFGAKGEIRPSSEIKVGDVLLGHADEPGRHVGLKINETIREA